MISAALFSIGLALTGGASHQTDNTAGLVVIDRPAVEIVVAVADMPSLQVGVDGFTLTDPCTAGTGPCPPTTQPAPTPIFGVDCDTGGRPAPCDPGPAPIPAPADPGLCTDGRADTGGNCN